MSAVPVAPTCSACGAALPLDVAAEGGACAFCGATVAGDPAIARARRRIAEEKIKLEEDRLRLATERQAAEAQRHAYEQIDAAVADARRRARFGSVSFWIQLAVTLLFVAGIGGTGFLRRCSSLPGAGAAGAAPGAPSP